MKKRALIYFLFVIIFLNLVSASIQLGNVSNSIDTQYGPLDNIRGWLNISFLNESATSVFSAWGNSISLVDLLKANQTYDYSCTTKNCIPDYSTTNGATTKSFSLGVGSSKTIGIKFSEEITAINSINFTVESNADASCFNQLTLDFLADGTIDFGNTKSATGDCSFLKNYGCFSDEKTSNEYIIGKFPNKHCQKINLSESPGFKIGAWTNPQNDSRNLTVAVYDLYGDPIQGANCIISNITNGESSCEIDYLVTKSKAHYVCIYSEKEGTSKIRGYSDSQGCGFYGVGVLNENAAFQIFAEGKKFDNFGSLNIKNSLPNSNTLGGKAEDYIIEKYNNLDCSAGCVVPLKFISQKQQDITVKDLQVKYETTLGPTTEANFYELNETSSKVNSGFGKLSLNFAGFLLPLNYGGNTFELKFNSESILSKNITIEKVPIISYVTPTKTASAYPTTFEVKIQATSNITKYKWEFGDGKSETTSEKKVVHTYNSTGDYDLKITVTDSNERSSYKTFTISVESPEKIINSTLIKMQKDLTKVQAQLNNFSQFNKESLESVLEISLMNDKLKEAQRDYKSAVSEEDYNKLMATILSIKIPESVVVSNSADQISFYPKKENINLDVLSTITSEDYDSENEANFIDGVFSWQQENIDVKIKFTELSSIYEDYTESTLNIFELDLKKKDSQTRDSYIILEKLDNLKFKENYLEEEQSGYVYINFEKESEKIVFSTTETIDFSNLPLFISPEISRLPLMEVVEKDEKETKWWIFIVIIIFLLVLGGIIYIILQEWYKRRYENYLFKNRNDLYNLVTFIQTSQSKGIEDSKIALKLRKAGWKSEQVTYALKKYSGKRTGMVEMPIEKVLNIFKRKKPANPIQNKVLPRGNFIIRPFLKK